MSSTAKRKKWRESGQNHHFRPALVTLEKRDLPAGTPVFVGTGLYLELDSQNDVVSLQYLDATTIRLTANGTNYDYARSAVTRFYADGYGGNDQLVVASDVTIPCRLYGSWGDDSLVGGAGDDELNGLIGNDTLIGNGGNDRLEAGDTFWGFGDSWGNGVLGPPPASSSQDSVFGGDGDDFIRGNPARDTLAGGAGSNTIHSVNDAQTLEVYWTYPGDEAPSENDTITISFINATTARATINGTNYDFDRTLVSEVYVNSGDGEDLVTIDSSVDVPVRVYAGDGNDTVLGAGTNDYLVGGEGDDCLVGNSGDDSLYGENGNDSLFGGDGNDSLDGGLGNDSLDGGLGNDSLDGGRGDDILYGNEANDTMFGGGGFDTYIVSPGSDDLIIDTSGADTLDFSLARRAVVVDLSRNLGQWQTVDAAGNRLALVGQFENVIGSRFDDWITGNALANRLDGGAGNDTLDGGGGDRDLFGKADGSTPDRNARPGTDGDELVGGEGNDWLDGGRGRDNLDGGAGDDVLVADPLLDKINGGPGANRDVLITKDPGGFGLLGVEEGPPAIFFDLDSGRLIVRGDADGPTNDHIIVAADATGWLEITINGVLHSANPLSPHYTEALANAQNLSVLRLNVRGLQGDDTIVVTAFIPDARLVLTGGGGDDLLIGGAGNELLRGGGGNDTLMGLAGNDVLTGGRGDDELDGGEGFDWANYSGAPGPVHVDLLKGDARGDGRDLLVGIEDAFGWLEEQKV